MQAYISVNGGGCPGRGVRPRSAATALTAASYKTYYCVAGTTLTVSDPAKGVLAGDTGANGSRWRRRLQRRCQRREPERSIERHLHATRRPRAGTCGGTFSLPASTAQRRRAPPRSPTATGNAACAGAAPTAGNGSYTSNIASRFAGRSARRAGVRDEPERAMPLTVDGRRRGFDLCQRVDRIRTDRFVATPSTATPATCSFTYKASNSTEHGERRRHDHRELPARHRTSPSTSTTRRDAAGSQGRDQRLPLDHRGRPHLLDRPEVPDQQPAATRLDSRGQACPPLPVESLGYNFHTANMPVVAQGCVGTISCEAGQTLARRAHVACDVGNGVCRPALRRRSNWIRARSTSIRPSATSSRSCRATASTRPSAAPAVRRRWQAVRHRTDCGAYDRVTDRDVGARRCRTRCAAMPWAARRSPPGQTRRSTSRCSRRRCRPAKISVFVFEDDFPLNGENDAGGGVDVLAPNEPGLGGFNITLFDQAGGLGDATGQMTYDMFNMPVSNALAGTIDPVTGLDACPITKRNDGTGENCVGMILTCPKYESDGMTLSPLAGQAVVANLYPGTVRGRGHARRRPHRARRRVAADQHAGRRQGARGVHQAQRAELLPGVRAGGFHVAIGFANPAIINAAQGAAQFCADARGGCTPHADGHGHERAHEPHARRAHSTAAAATTLRLHPVLRVGLGPRTARTSRSPSATPDGKFDFHQHARRATSSSPSSTSGTTSWSTAWSTPVTINGNTDEGDSRSRSGAPTSTPAPSSTRTATACRRTTSPACRWWRPTSATATAASPSSTTPT